MKKPREQLQPAHIELATIATAAMALVLALGLKIIGLIDRIDGFLYDFFLPRGMKAPTLSLHSTFIWISTALLVLLLPTIILRIPGTWRRYLVWILTTALMILWAPVLILASHKPDISIAIIAVLWAGFCAIVYAHNHSLPVDESSEPPEISNDAPS